MINLMIANKVIAKVQEKAKDMGLKVVVAISDASGNPISIQCMDGAFLGSFDIALNKAFTSTAFQMSTETLSGLAKPESSLYGIQFTNHGKIVIFGGGDIIKHNNCIVGAIGVSGGSAAEDVELATHGVNVCEEILRG
ncbi:DhaG protein [Candidatus Epulonipiscium fishelsonii]|uniref:DhaG protein n=1 Tax=Candidatus Epulonipiscium fishelsonii TaxID=77094 RepID=A0ACC8X6Y5_9FIRM|nr:DhaG protein [Epulopiscium sp. SCG-B11WGA-EpuloA1]ONI38331.1 DhaG protein [Epulopiscium sp. SCG-B05WGA-EpuloA1]